MSRYFGAGSNSAPGNENNDDDEGVFRISSKTIEKVKSAQSKRRDKRRHNPYKQKVQHRIKGADAFPGKAPVDPEKLERHSRGSEGVDQSRVKTKFRAKEASRREEKIAFAEDLAARTELLLDDQVGYLEGDTTDEFTGRVNQTQIRQAVDPISASKGFDLNLQQFGPYKIDYTRNGRHMVLGGRRGHVAAFDWATKQLKCEINVQESVHNVKWLHTENMFAVAQKKWTYIYDNQGIELHCLKKLDNVIHMEFLPYHFLLATASDRGFLSWVDISMGKMVAQFNSRQGPLNILAQNPTNAVLLAGHSKGTVTMWTPNMRDPAAKMLAHSQAVRAVTVDKTGNYMATAGADRSLKIWDVRQFKLLKDYKLNNGPTHLQFSGRNMLGVACGNIVELYKDPCLQDVEYPYLTHKVFKSITDIKFAPYEDVMGIGHAAGFSSILVPGSGEANFDALEVNPYQTKTQRREAEVKALLEKIQPDLITLDPGELGSVNVSKLEEDVLEKNKKLFIKPPKIDFEPRNKTKGRSSTSKTYHIKKQVVEEEKRRDLQKQIEAASNEPREGKAKKEKKPKALLDRFK